MQEDFSGEFMGKPFHGIGITGYDNLKKKYVGSWIDDMGTGLFISEGDADAEGFVVHFVGYFVENGPVACWRMKNSKYMGRR